MWLYMCVMCTFCNDIRRGIVIHVLKELFQGLPMCVIDCLPLMPFRNILKVSYQLLLVTIIYFVSGNCFLLMLDEANSTHLSLVWFPLFPSSLDSKYKKWSCVPKVKTHFDIFSVFEFSISLFWVIFSFLIETAFWICINQNLR